MSYSFDDYNDYDRYPSGTVNNTPYTRRNVTEPDQSYYNNNRSHNNNNPNNHTQHNPNNHTQYNPNNHTQYGLNQPQSAYVTNEKDDAEIQHDVETVPLKYNKQKNQIITKSPVKWYKNTRAVLQMFKSNFLLIFLPPAIILKRFEVKAEILLFFNFLAIIPMSKIMTVGINDLSARLHPVGNEPIYLFFILLFI